MSWKPRIRAYPWHSGTLERGINQKSDQAKSWIFKFWTFCKIWESKFQKRCWKPPENIRNEVFRSRRCWATIMPPRMQPIIKKIESRSEISEFSLDFVCLLGHFFGRYLSRECRNVTGTPGFVVFRQRRYSLKKITLKNIKFSKSYRFFKKGQIFSSKKSPSLWN